MNITPRQAYLSVSHIVESMSTRKLQSTVDDDSKGHGSEEEGSESGDSTALREVPGAVGAPPIGCR